MSIFGKILTTLGFGDDKAAAQPSAPAAVTPPTGCPAEVRGCAAHPARAGGDRGS